LSLTLAAGLLLWAWLPVLLFRAVGVERPPVKATLSMGEKPKFLASLGWGFVAFLVTLVIGLTLANDPVIGYGVALGVGYLVALAMATIRRKGEAQGAGGESEE
ncbi:MAG: hypothetical protein R3185_09335, partial [Candidatus Thermoplasmatota archaeon]|nr:hypothetical protein [Candidatus Thermoplasmatota archaeon]